jgi:predicted ArsR family transcriptional regulator
MTTTAARSITLTDPRALRALAHPLRPRLLGLLRREGPLTATQAGKLVGESAASCSFHFRQLAKFGLVEEAGGGHGRERPWRATAQFTSWPSGADDPELAAAAQEFERVVAGRYLERVLGWIERRVEESGEWQDSSVFSDAMLYVTVEELDELRLELEAIVDRFHPRTADPMLRPEGARRVDLIQLAFPAEDG